MNSRLLVWARPGQESIIREAVDTADVELAAVMADTNDESSALGTALATDRVVDLRQAVHEGNFDILWLASNAVLTPDQRRLLRASRLLVVSTEPRPPALGDLLEDADEGQAFHTLPLLRSSEGYRAARQGMADLNSPHAILVSMRCPPEAGSLFARLYDAFDILARHGGDLELVMASISSPDQPPGATGHDVPESLMNLHGHMTVNVRFAENRCAGLVLSNVSETWFRGVTMLSTDGCVRVTDVECDLPGEPPPRTRGRRSASLAAPTAGALIGAHLRRLLDDLDLDDPQPDHAQLLALCEAARLSARTGQAESPSRLREMLSRV
jgi:hypothetical protein